jgi:hypothetical protein
MSKTFVYCSATGNGDYLAGLMEKHGFETLKLEPKKPFGKMGFFKMMHYGHMAIKHYAEPLLPYVYEEDAMSTLVLGSPVWASRLSTPINTFIKDHPLGNRKVIVILYGMGEKNPKAEKHVVKKIPGAIVYYLQNPTKNHEEVEKLLDSIL